MVEKGKIEAYSTISFSRIHKIRIKKNATLLLLHLTQTHFSIV